MKEVLAEYGRVALVAYLATKLTQPLHIAATVVLTPLLAGAHAPPLGIQR